MWYLFYVIHGMWNADVAFKTLNNKVNDYVYCLKFRIYSLMVKVKQKMIKQHLCFMSQVKGFNV